MNMTRIRIIRLAWPWPSPSIGLLVRLVVGLLGLLGAAGSGLAAGRPVLFSEVSGIFTNEFDLELRPRAAGAIVRYTLDGSEPGAESPRYTAPLRIDGTRQIRARAFDAAGRAGEVVSQTYIVVDPSVAGFDSNLPLAVVATFGQEINRDDRVAGVLFVIGDGGDGREGGDGGRIPGAGQAGGRVRLVSPAETFSRVWINHRGRASTRYPKRSFTVKALDEADDFRRVPILGMPKDSDWVLYAPYPDKTLMRDVLAYELSRQVGRWAPRTRYVELFVQERPGRLGREDYAGVYVITERVKRDADRVNVTKLGPDDNAEPAVTGGYLFKKDHSSRSLGPMIPPGYPPFEASTSSKTGFPTGPGGFPADPAGFQPPYRGRSSTSSSSSRSSSSSSRSTRPAILTNIVGAPVAPKREVTTSRSVMIDEDGNEMMISDEEEDSIDTSFKTTVLTNRFYYVDPEPDEMTTVQKTWLRRHLEDTERAISGRDFRSPDRGYAAYLDVDSFIDYHLLVEVTKNVDGFRFSTFYNKDRGGKIKMGPLWDWNLSFGNCNGKQGYLPTFWLWPQLDDREYTWFRRLFEDPDFGQRYVDRWTELRAAAFATSNLVGRVDQLAAYLDEAQKRNFERWPILGMTINPNWFLADTYAGEVAWMREWIEKRLAWMEAQFVAPPDLRRDGSGQVRLGSTGTGPEVYYTVDGSDPRAPGGAVSAKARRYAEPVAVDGPLFARARVGERWSGPVRIPAGSR